MAQRRLSKLLLSLACLFVCSGCSLRSRWALDDADYRKKYGQDTHDAPLARKLKRAADGRWLANKNGASLGIGGQSDPDTLGGEVELFTYPHSTLEVHGGLTGLAGTSSNDYFGGAQVGARLQAPSRVAPFVGVGGLVAYSEKSVLANNDDVDNDEDDIVDEADERQYVVDNAIAAIYPEVGVHLWANSRLRLTGAARYQITSDGRDHDNWYFGINVGFLPRYEERLAPVLNLDEGHAPPLQFEQPPEFDAAAPDPMTDQPTVPALPTPALEFVPPAEPSGE